MGTLVNVTLVRVSLNWLPMTAPNSHIFELLVQPFKSGLVVVASSASSIFFGGGGGGRRWRLSSQNDFWATSC